MHKVYIAQQLLVSIELTNFCYCTSLERKGKFRLQMEDFGKSYVGR